VTGQSWNKVRGILPFSFFFFFFLASRIVWSQKGRFHGHARDHTEIAAASLFFSPLFSFFSNRA